VVGEIDQGRRGGTPLGMRTIVAPWFALLLVALPLASPCLCAAEVVFFSSMNGTNLRTAFQGWIRVVDEGSKDRADEGLAFSAVSYISGYREGLDLGQGMMGTTSTRYEWENWRLTPGNITTEQLMRVVWKFMNDHPEKLHEPAGMLIYTAAAVAWPRPPIPGTKPQ